MVQFKKFGIVSAIIMFAYGGLVSAQFTESISGFETDREGNELVDEPGSFGDLQVVIFQDPQEANVTAANIKPDGEASTNGLGRPSTEETFVFDLREAGQFGADFSDQFLNIRFEWANSNGDRWALIETLQSPIQGDPSLHLEGVVRMKINFPDCSAFEFGQLVHSSRIGVALLIRETGNDLPQGFRDSSLDGDLEFVGVSSVANAGTADPVPVPTTYVDVTDGNLGQCTSQSTDPDCPPSGPAHWICLEFDLDDIETAGQVIGWSFNGGDGILDATTNGEGVNRGVLAGLVLTPDVGDTTSEYIDFRIDSLEFDAPEGDPTFPPTLGEPIIETQDSVRVNNVLSSSTDVQLEIDRAGGAVGFTEIYNVGPGGSLFVDIGVFPALAIGDQLRARQTNPAGISAYSAVVTVTPPANFSVTIAIDEDGSTATATYEFVGSSSDIPRGHPVFEQIGVWQNIEFSLVPGVEPVTSFVGGDGQLQPDGGDYSIDSLWFTIDPVNLQTEDYDVFVDHVYYIDENDAEILISDAELTNPFPSLRGQSDAHVINNSSGISNLASFDGTRSNRHQWDFISPPAESRRYAVYRPGVAFADSAKAVGFWLYVGPPTQSTVRRPTVLGPVVGAATAVSVDLTTNGVTEVELFVNGQSAATITSPADPAVIDTSMLGLTVGDDLTATQTTAEATSDLSFPRRVTAPTPPRLQLQPITDADTSVVVTNVYNAVGSTASLVTVLADGGEVGSANPAGASTVIVTIPELAVGTVVTATQEVNGLTSAPSLPNTVIVGDVDCVVIYRQDFETDTTASWTVNDGPTDEAANFFFDYSTVGIPVAPNCGPTGARGMKLQTNLTSGTFGGFSVSPTGQNFSGDYTLAFDWWGNFNGPFPAGGSGSTNLSTFGIGTAGTGAQYPGVADSVWFGGTADGGSSADWRAYSPAAVASYQDGDPVYAATTRNSSNAYYSVFGGVTAPAAQVALFPNQTGSTNVGSGGMGWHDVSITKKGNNVTWRVDGLLIASIDISTITLGGGNILFGHSDINAGSSTDPNAPAMLFTLIDNVRVLVGQPGTVTLGDWDSDSDVDYDDYQEFACCMFGPGVLPSRSDSCTSACLDTFDFDLDADVDLDDFSDFELLFP